ncbi:uncharacterized protein LOC110849594 [Folsomia candida]|uniref:Uncharacterized protein n=1 Tax=Folsomia candida TaxID=158441 RepID=A0A226E826_FOLCA|nr:uncharacterized protein LOC110849594 [Folsomia candida]OXA53460.1 hypothetical protein Fcan01_10242 [Folsomia candida]
MALSCPLPPGGWTTHFNSIPDFCCAKRAFDERGVRNLIDEFKRIFLDHDVQEEYGLIMNHRHFLLEENEILVETLKQDGNISVAFPWRVKDGEAHPTPNSEWDQYNLTRKEFIIPQTWKFDQHGSLIPYEFLASDSPQPEPSRPFVAVLFEVMRQHGVQDALGLRRLDGDRNGEAFEVTPEGRRVSVTTMGSKPDNISGTVGKVLWYFTKDGNTEEAMACTRCGQCVVCCVIM